MAGFIVGHLEEIVAEWEAFARTLTPAARAPDAAKRRDHAREMLEAIAADIDAAPTAGARARKPRGLARSPTVRPTAATHGQARQEEGFDLQQLVAEFRALRASVLRIWIAADGDLRAAPEIARFNEAVDQALAESVATFCEALSRSRETFLGILGHDLRSPLDEASGALEVLAAPVDDADRRRAIASGKRGIAAMDGMIRDLLEFTRTRLGEGIPIAPAPANLEKVCKATINEISFAFPHTAFRFESGGSLEGSFDPERMHQVVANLVYNAVQHGRRGAAVSLVARGEEGTLGFRVTNEGPAIGPERLDAIFDPLAQVAVDGNENHRTTHLGLGLYIAREIVHAHGGTIDASSTNDEGTTFSVTLPRRLHPAAAPMA